MNAFACRAQADCIWSDIAQRHLGRYRLGHTLQVDGTARHCTGSVDVGCCYRTVPAADTDLGGAMDDGVTTLQCGIDRLWHGHVARRDLVRLKAEGSEHVRDPGRIARQNPDGVPEALKRTDRMRPDHTDWFPR